MFSGWLNPPASPLPPDIVIEVGPPPFTRFVAHSALISVHSGYLRAALRTDTTAIGRGGGGTCNVIDTAVPSMAAAPIYLPNVTAEQFTPLLAYMYTGFLDLNADNIFGVLLATHILHMPRALELCRAFLSAAQLEGYFGGTIGGMAADIVKPIAIEGSSKVVRPIASKPPATAVGLGFVSPPAAHILLPSIHTPFKSLVAATVTARVPHVSPEGQPAPPAEPEIQSPAPKTVEHVKREEASPIETVVPKPPPPKDPKRTNATTKGAPSTMAVSSSGAPGASLGTGDPGVIIDIASCDGPVRFRRVLNDTYGFGNGTTTSSTRSPSDGETKHSHRRYVSASFHQQMARNINESRVSADSMAALSDESSYSHKDENSQDNGGVHPEADGGLGAIITATSETGNYTCIYCKHTFKSQYCYQKHAKRHLIPLRMDDGETEGSTGGGNGGTTSAGGVSTATTTVGSKSAPGAVGGGIPARKATIGTQIVKREVKPLDMNVQYYPCKTCGSKFPSYYFVHKHRKLCHAEEEV